MKRCAVILLLLISAATPAADYGPYTLSAPVAIDGDTLRADVQRSRGHPQRILEDQKTMNINAENLIRIGLVVGGLILGGTGGVFGTQAFTQPTPKPTARPAVTAEVDCLQIRIPLDKVKIDQVRK